MNEKATVSKRMTIIKSNGIKVTLNIEKDTDGNLIGSAAQKPFRDDAPLLTDDGTLTGAELGSEITFTITWNSGLKEEFSGGVSLSGRLTGSSFELTQSILTTWASIEKTEFLLRQG